MTQTKKKYLTISKGQISPKLIERTDIELLDKSGQEVLNFENTNFGSLKTMKGTFTNGEAIHDGMVSVRAENTKVFPILINGNQYWLVFIPNYINIVNIQGYKTNVYIEGLEPRHLNISVAQYNELILVSTGVNPLWQIKYDETENILSYDIYKIPETEIPKQSPVQESTLQAPQNNFIQIGLDIIKKQIFDISKLRVQQSEGLGNTGSKGTFTIHFVENSSTVTDYLITKIISSGTTATTIRKKIQATFAGQILKANNNTQVILIESVRVDIDAANQQVQLKSVTGRFLIGADNIDTTTGKMKSTDDWTLEICPPLFSGGLIGNNDSPWNIENYPSTITFYQNRLVIGGSQLNGSQVVFSKTGDYDDFSEKDGLNTDGFQLIIGSSKKEEIQHLLVRQGLQIFCKESEWQLENGIVSRTNGFIKNSDIGSSLTKPIISPNGSTLFVEKKGNNLVEYQYNYQTNSYEIPYLNILTDIIGDAKITHLFLNKTSQGNYIYACLDNGDLITMNYMQSHNIESFTKYHFDNIKFIATSVWNNTNDIVLFVNNSITLKESILSTIKPVNNININALGVMNDFSKNGNEIRFSSYSILNKATDINIYDSNGNYINTYNAINNTIILTNEDTEKDIAYIGINIKSKFVSNPLNYGVTTFDKYKNIAQLKIVVSEDSNPEFLTVNGKKGRKKDNFITFYRVARPSRKCQFTVENNIYPCEILSMEVDLEI